MHQYPCVELPTASRLSSTVILPWDIFRGLVSSCLKNSPSITLLLLPQRLPDPLPRRPLPLFPTLFSRQPSAHLKHHVSLIEYLPLPIYPRGAKRLPSPLRHPTSPPHTPDTLHKALIALRESSHRSCLECHCQTETWRSSWLWMGKGFLWFWTSYLGMVDRRPRSERE